MNGTSLLLSDANGIYIPQMFCQGYALDKWGLDPDGWAAQTCLLGPYGPDYWEAWDQILQNAEFYNLGFKFRLWQDGDLWAYCPELMTDEERKNFGFEEAA